MFSQFSQGKFLLEYECSFQAQMGQISDKSAGYAENTSFIKTSYTHQNRQLYEKLNIYLYIKRISCKKTFLLQKQKNLTCPLDF